MRKDKRKIKREKCANPIKIGKREKENSFF